MNVKSFHTVDYENKSNWKLGENKHKTNPIKPNLLNAQMNVNKVLTKDYENVPLRRRGENKPNQTQFQTGALFTNTKNTKVYRCPDGKAGHVRTYSITCSLNGDGASLVNNNAMSRSVRKYFRPFLKNGCIMVPKARWAIPRVSFTLNHLCLTWFGHGIAAVGAGPGRRFHAVMAILGPGRIIEVGLVNLVPGDLLAGVTGDLTHHGYHCAADHVVAVIDGLAGANRLEEYVVLSLVWIASALPAPVCFAPYPASQNRGPALAAMHNAGSTVIASGRRSAEGVDRYTVGKFVNDGMVVEYIAVDRVGH